MARKIKIFDTTLRDGEQSPGCSMHLNEKLELALQLEKLNVDVIEAGFAIASPGDFKSVKAVKPIKITKWPAFPAHCPGYRRKLRGSRGWHLETAFVLGNQPHSSQI